MNILLDRSMSLQGKAIYLYLQKISNGKEEFKIKSQEIQKELGIGCYQYHSHIRRLVDSGYIELEMTRDEKKRYSGMICKITGGNKNG